jgi:Fe-S cluster assembly protein SufD
MTPAIQNNVTLNAFREAFDASPRTLEQVKAFQEFCKIGLPSTKAEEYRFTPIGKFLEANFDLSLYGRASESSISEFNTDDESILLQVVNGKITTSDKQIYESGIRIESGNTTIDSQYDPFALLNQAFCENEIRIVIPSNHNITKPIKINHILDSEADQLMLNSRMVLELGENSTCSIVESFESSGINPVFSNIVTQYTLQSNSHLHYYRLQNDAGLYQVYNSTVKQVGASTIDSFVFSFDGSVLRNNSLFSIEAERCRSNFYGLYLPSGKALIDNHTVADHRLPNCISNELYKGIISDNAKGVFNGKIYVRPDAQKTNAFQSNRNILLSDTASINTKPQLEIWADDVKCSHGCTTGQLDKEAMFYLQSRGISMENARTMLLLAFAAEVTSKMEDLKLRAEIENIIADRLHSPY